MGGPGTGPWKGVAVRHPLRDVRRDQGLVAGLLTVAALAGLDAATRVPLTGVYAVGAVVAALLTGARRTAYVVAAALLAALASGVWNADLRSVAFLVRLTVCAGLGGLAVYSAWVRERREARLRRLAVIAETAQRAVLRSLPDVIGSVGFASRYVSATEEASIGGDLYEVAATPYGVRVVVGDVRGKGLPAVQTAASVLGAFRQAAFSEPDIAGVAAVVDEVVARIVDDEEFVTAVIAQFTDDRVVLVNCGHHPPLLLDGGGARVLDTGEPTTPWGLTPEPRVVEHAFGPEDRLLIYTDGLVESRDRSGRFFPLEEHTGVLSGLPLGEALDELVERLRRFAGGRIADDVALVLAERRRA